MENKENWRPVAGFEGVYEVSDLGRVRSLDRVQEYQRGSLTIKRLHKGRILSPCSSLGYPSVNLRGIQTKLHRIVCVAFHGEPGPNQEVLHKDGSRTNSRADNLRWGTRSENIEDMFLHGVIRRRAPKKTIRQPACGEKQHLAKLTGPIVREMRKLAAAGESSASIARQFGVAHKTAWRAIVRQTWKHIQ